MIYIVFIFRININKKHNTEDNDEEEKSTTYQIRFI